MKVYGIYELYYDEDTGFKNPYLNEEHIYLNEADARSVAYINNERLMCMTNIGAQRRYLDTHTQWHENNARIDAGERNRRRYPEPQLQVFTLERLEGFQSVQEIEVREGVK